jgi:hypothetical protein
MCGQVCDFTTYTNLTFGYVCTNCLTDLRKDGMYDKKTAEEYIKNGKEMPKAPPVSPNPPMPMTPPKWMHSGEPEKDKKLTKSQARKRRKKLKKLARQAMRKNSRTQTNYKKMCFPTDFRSDFHRDFHSATWRDVKPNTKTPPPDKSRQVEREHYNAVALYPQLFGKSSEQTG